MAPAGGVQPAGEDPADVVRWYRDARKPQSVPLRMGCGSETTLDDVTLRSRPRWEAAHGASEAPSQLTADLAVDGMHLAT